MTKKKSDLILRIAEQLQDYYRNFLKDSIENNEAEYFDDLYGLMCKDFKRVLNEREIENFKYPSIHFPASGDFVCCISFKNYNKEYICLYKLKKDRSFEVVTFGKPKKYTEVAQHIL